jgi:hypothetical protein
MQTLSDDLSRMALVGCIASWGRFKNREPDQVKKRGGRAEGPRDDTLAAGSIRQRGARSPRPALASVSALLLVAIAATVIGVIAANRH